MICSEGLNEADAFDALVQLRQGEGKKAKRQKAKAKAKKGNARQARQRKAHRTA